MHYTLRATGIVNSRLTVEAPSVMTMAMSGTFRRLLADDPNTLSRIAVRAPAVFVPELSRYVMFLMAFVIACFVLYLSRLKTRSTSRLNTMVAMETPSVDTYRFSMTLMTKDFVRSKLVTPMLPEESMRNAMSATPAHAEYKDEYSSNEMA